MKNSILLLLFLCISLFTSRICAQNSLRVGDPRNSWWTEWGTMEEVTLTAKPQGTYIECGLYITFSAKGTQWYNRSDSLEVTFQFQLPPGAIVHDSWLWIGNDIIRGRILDRWTASAIYEGYVRRRTDPSILFKNGDDQYELKVFPMAGNQKRQVKISYLVPAKWSSQKIEAELPLPALRASRYAPKLTVLAWENEHGKVPDFPSMPGQLTRQNPAEPNVLQANLTNWNFPTDISYQSPAQKGYYVSSYSDQEGSGFYQLSFLPGFLTNIQHHKKVAFLLDFDAAGGITTMSQMLGATKYQMRQHLGDTDSFNLIFSNLNIRRVSEKWMPATYANIEAAFANAETRLASYSNLPALLVNGIQFVQQNKSGGQLLVLSNASQFSALQAANTLLKDVQAQMPNPPIPVHTVDYYTKGTAYVYVNGTYYYGNTYFLSTLSAVTKGDHQSISNQGLDNALNACLNNLEVNIEAFDFHTRLEDGFCYGRFYPDGVEDAIFPNRPIVQIGKYKGTFPFKVEISGELEGRVVHGEISVPKEEIIEADSLLREIWFGHYISLLETGSQPGNIIREIIATSMQERVLSRYTAFFCPEDTSLICRSCVDDTNVTDTDNTPAPDSLLTAYPNPFRDHITFVIEQTQQDKNAQLDIMTISGQLVQTFSLPPSEGKTTLEWDGGDVEGGKAPAGVYLAILKTGNTVKVLKLIKTGD